MERGSTSSPRASLDRRTTLSGSAGAAALLGDDDLDDAPGSVLQPAGLVDDVVELARRLHLGGSGLEAQAAVGRGVGVARLEAAARLLDRRRGDEDEQGVRDEAAEGGGALDVDAGDDVAAGGEGCEDLVARDAVAPAVDGRMFDQAVLGLEAVELGVAEEAVVAAGG